MAGLKRLLLVALLFTALALGPAQVLAERGDGVGLLVVELVPGEGGPKRVYAVPPEDDSATNPDYVLLGIRWSTTARIWVNPSNKNGFSASVVVAAVTASAEAWDVETSAAVFAYQGATSRGAGKRDGYNVVAWGAYKKGVIAVTYIWYRGTEILETDTRMNTLYGWSLSGEAKKMDLQNIMTHEFGHWAGLADLYNDADYWLTMFGYSDYGETYKRTLGLGDINGLRAVYGA